MKTINAVLDHEAQTDLRLTLLERGYRPLPCAAKVVFMKGWPSMEVSTKTIGDWPIMGPGFKPAVTTAIQLQGTMLAIDVDVDDELVTLKIEDLMAEVFGQDTVDAAPLRDSGGNKFMMLLRTEEPYGMWKTPKYVDPDGKDHMVEVYGGDCTRYFSCFGPHTIGEDTRDGYEILKEYRWAEGPTPLDTRPEELPLITKEQLHTFMMKADDLLSGVSNWERISSSKGGTFEARVIYDLNHDMIFHTASGDLTYMAAIHHAHTERDPRCSSSFLGDGSSNTSKCRMRVVGAPEEEELQVFDNEAWVTHLHSSYAPKTNEERVASISALGAALSRITPEEVREAIDAAADEGADTAAFEARLDELFEELAFNYIDGTYHWMRRGVVWSGIKRATLVADLRQYDLRWTGPRGGSKRMSIVDAWEHMPDRIKIAGVRFRPDIAERVFTETREAYLNGFCGFPLVDQGARDDEARAVLDEFMLHLVPDAEERAWLWTWMATKYQRPWERNCAVVFVAPGIQGAGRGSLFSILDRVFDGYTGTISETDLLGARFNSFMEKNIVVFCNEIGGLGWSERKKGYETLKDRIDPSHNQINVERKKIEAYNSKTFTSFMLATNNPGALTIDAEDRRMAIITNGSTVEDTPLLARVLDVGFDRVAAEMALQFAVEGSVRDRGMTKAPHFAGREVMLTANETDLDDAIARIVSEAPPWRAWIRSDFDVAVKLAVTGSSHGKVPGLRGAVTELVGKRAERAGVELLSERAKVGTSTVAVLAKDPAGFMAATPEGRAQICKGVEAGVQETNVVPLR